MRRVVPILLALCGCSHDAASSVEPVIFGADDRVEVYEVTRPELADAVRGAVPAMIRARSVNVDETTGRVTFSNRRLGDSHDLCPGEPHEDQPAAAGCSATLIDDDLVLTAGHCVDGWACADQRFVFGWYYDAPGMIHGRTTDDVFSCAEVVVWEYTTDNDYAIVRLDRPAPGPPMEVRTTPVRADEPVSLAGFPFGIPMKVVENGVVTAVLSTSRFYARLDAQPGNSGSGVYDAELRVVGDLTNGPVEALVADGDCNRLAVIGEEGIRTELISSVVPAMHALCASGHESPRLCGVCGDGACGPVELCPEDCAIDGGASVDASVSRDASVRDDASFRADAAVARDAGVARDASTPPADAPREPDAGPIMLATHCGCRAGQTAPGRTAMEIAFLLVALGGRRRSARRGSRCGSAAST